MSTLSAQQVTEHNERMARGDCWSAGRRAPAGHIWEANTGEGWTCGRCGAVTRLPSVAKEVRPNAAAAGDCAFASAVERQAEREVGKGGLQEQILAHCRAQWPKWKVIQSRSDQRSAIAVGAHDMTIYLPKGAVLNIECKAKGKKQSKEQLSWAKELEMLGHFVYVVRDLNFFIGLAQQEIAEQSHEAT